MLVIQPSLFFILRTCLGLVFGRLRDRNESRTPQESVDGLRLLVQIRLVLIRLIGELLEDAVIPEELRDGSTQLAQELDRVHERLLVFLGKHFLLRFLIFEVKNYGVDSTQISTL